LNKLPDFSSNLEQTLEIKVYRDTAGEIMGPEMFKYVSPAAIDPDGDKVYMKFQGLEGKVWASTRVNTDGTFQLKVMRSLVMPEDAGEYTMFVGVGDGISPGGNIHKIQIDLQYHQLLPEEQEQYEQSQSGGDKQSGFKDNLKDKLADLTPAEREKLASLSKEQK